MINNYGYEVISCSKIDDNYINTINIKNYINKKLVLQVKNTKYVDKKTLIYLKQLKNKYNIDIKISVLGPYFEDGARNEKEKEKYFYNTIYNIDELYQIITEFEKIEENISPKWNEFDIVVYLAEVLVRNIMYDPKYLLMYKKGKTIPKVIGQQDESDFFDRSLRGVLTRKTVCAGFSVIFKELANRNGIECRYVSGIAYNDDGTIRGGHAWNLIRINGIIYPLDITWKNSKYRNGDFKNIEDISCDIETFKKRHKSYNKSLDENLTQLDIDIIKKSKKKTSIRKHFNASTYIIKRNNKTQFVLSQIGTYKGLYRYLYAEINENGNYEIPTILFSESNFLKELNKYKFEKNYHYNEFLNSFANVLFSKENIYESNVIKNTKYIGCCELSTKYAKKIQEINKTETKIKEFTMPNIKSQKRTDGTTLTLVQFPNKSGYEYYIYVLKKGPSILEYNIFTNENYFNMDPSIVVNDILSDNNLNINVKKH